MTGIDSSRIIEALAAAGYTVTKMAAVENLYGPEKWSDAIDLRIVPVPEVYPAVECDGNECSKAC
ncbi:MAG: hypothetical protein FWD88_05425 [Treponema sp.]|nr:hypothetical protein [Treponema sp.]